MRSLIAFTQTFWVRGMRILPPTAGRSDVDFKSARRRKFSENAILLGKTFIVQNVSWLLRFLRVEMQNISIHAIIDRFF